MTNKKQNKVKQGGIRLSADIDAKLHQLAQESGQTVTWWIENLLAVSLGLRDWPKQPKGIKEARKLTNDHTSETTRTES